VVFCVVTLYGLAGDTNVSKENTASFFWAAIYIPTKCWPPTYLLTNTHVVTIQKKNIEIFNAVRSSNLPTTNIYGYATKVYARHVASALK
jgi:hypothetical protein